MQITRFEHKSSRGILLAFLSIAMLLAALLTVSAQDNSVFASIRVYEGVDPDDQKEIARVTDEGFLPIMRQSDGFVGYYLLPAGDMLASVSLFDTAEKAAASNEKARDFVAENLTPLLPNPPMIVEGAVDVMHVADIDRMMDDASALYASLRIYHVGNMQDIEESNRLVEAQLLPALQASGGLFSYYSLSDGVNTVIGLNVYSSEENALAANDVAAAFVAEHMMDWLPEDPMRINGQLAVAALAGLRMGENLIDNMMDERQVFVSIRLYEGVDPADQKEIARVTDEGFLPIMRESDGFVGYYLLPAGDMLASVSLFDTAEKAAASNEKARDFVAENLTPLLPNPPQITEGGLDVMYAIDELMDAGTGSLYAALRIYDNYDLTDREVAVELVETGFLPILQEADGLFSYFSMDDGVDRVVTLSVYETEENALAANALAADFVAEYMTEWIPEEPARINGRLGVAALADLHMGENLIDDMLDEGQAFVSIRLYDGLDPNDMDDLYSLTAEGILEILRQSDGFIGYYWLHTGENVLAISLFATEAQASASNDVARDYVAEHLAGLVPNPPLIVDGPVHIGFVEMLDGMGDGGLSSLHASLRIYDGFETDNLDAFVRTVEDGFLPLMRETDGFFGYYLMDDGAGALAAVSIFDSEASAATSNEKAQDFVAEYLTAFLPSAPSVTSGQLDIAALAAVNKGANLIDNIMDDSVFASVRVYDGVDPANQEEIARVTDEGFLPILRESDGFVGYYLLPSGDKLASVTMFDSAEQAAASNEKARDFVVARLAPFLPNPPQIVEGLVEVMYVADADEMMMDEGITSLHALLAIYDGFDMTYLDETVTLVESIFLPELRENGGLVSYYGIGDGVDKAIALRIADSEERLQQGSDIAADFVAEYLADWLPVDPTTVSGRLGVAALASMQMGANLAEYSQDEASAFASVRVYDGVDPANQDTIARLTAEGFLPIMRESDGFVGYFLLAAGDKLGAVSLFDSAGQASASNEAAREFVVENLAPLLPNAPMIIEGPLSINHVAALHSSGDYGGVGELHASIRFYDGFDLRHFDEANDLAISHLLPALQELGGLFAQFAFNDGEDTVVGISIFESEEAALAANDAGKAFTIEYLADWAPNPPTGVAGQIAIATLAEIDMGANLIGEMMGEG